jgi:lysophospholipase L1-like esterase
MESMRAPLLWNKEHFVGGVNPSTTLVIRGGIRAQLMIGFLMAGLCIGLLLVSVMSFHEVSQLRDKLSRYEQLFSNKALIPISSEQPKQQSHAQVRLQIIESHMSQFPNPSILFLGDSIVEGLFVNQFCGLGTLNAGLGGAGVELLVNHLSNVWTRLDSPIVILAVGVNDSMRGRDGLMGEDYLTRWAKYYDGVLQTIRDHGAVPVVVSVLPVERNMPLGEDFFNSEVIRRMNKVLQAAAKKEGAVFVDAYTVFADASGAMKSGSTKDGVHLTAESYKTFVREIEQGVREAAKRANIVTSCGS